VGKKKYADVEEEAKTLIADGTEVIAELENLVDKDAEVFEPLSKAYGLPRKTPEEIEYKEKTMEQCCKTACSVPMEIMRKAYQGIKIHERMGQIGTMIAISDVGCGVAFMKAALVSGSLNVIINLNAIKDQTFVKETREEMNQLLTDGSKIADETFELVVSKLTK
jgi:formiminotetrahydrofolate cyclodeaminase